MLQDPELHTTIHAQTRPRGAHNSLEKVYFNPGDEAVIFVRLTNGMSIVLANLSTLAAQRANGTIPNDEELRRKWLRMKA